MIATWLVEIYLSKINTLEDFIATRANPEDTSNHKSEQETLEEEFRNFLDTYKVITITLYTPAFSQMFSFVSFILQTVKFRQTYYLQSYRQSWSHQRAAPLCNFDWRLRKGYITLDS